MAEFGEVLADIEQQLAARPVVRLRSRRVFFAGYLLAFSTISWLLGHRTASPLDVGIPDYAAEEAGRDPSQLKCIVGAPAHISDDLADAREQVRWFPAMVSNHVMDLIDRYGADGSAVPKALTDYVQARKFYDYDEHSRVGAKHGEFVTDEICDRFCVLGNIEQATEKLRELESIGVDQFNIYLMTEGQEATLETYGREIIPRFNGGAA